MKRLLPLSLPLTLVFIAPALVRAAAPSTPAAPLAATISAEILADTTAIMQGKPFTIAITLTTAPDWHIYWSNAGETGVATSFKWTRAQYPLEPLGFPIPSTFVQPGGAMAFGYTGKTTFVFGVVPPKATAAATGTFSVDVNWLACGKDPCVPGNATLKLIVPLTLQVEQSKEANTDVFDAAWAALPAGVPPNDLFAMAVPFAGKVPDR